MDNKKSWSSKGKIIDAGGRSISVCNESDASFIVDEYNKVIGSCQDTSENITSHLVPCEVDLSKVVVKNTNTSKYQGWFTDPVEAKQWALANNFALLVYFPSIGCSYCEKWWKNVGNTASFMNYCDDLGVVLLKASYKVFTYVKAHWKGKGLKLGAAPMLFLFTVNKCDESKKNHTAYYSDEMMVMKSTNTFKNKDTGIFGRSFNSDEYFFDIYTGDNAGMWNPVMMEDIIDAGCPYEPINL